MTLAAQKVKLKTIFKEHWEGFWKDYREEFPKDMHKTIEEAVEKMIGCGDIANGYFHYKCVSCGHGDTKVGFSCKSRFCPRCGKIYTDEWVEKTAESVADVEHRHLVFTIPEEFRGVFYWTRKLLKQLADLAKETIEAELERQQKRNGSKEKLIAGILIVIHTFGRDLKWNPHIHVLIADRAIEKKSGRVIKFPFLLYRTFHKVWQYKFLNFLKKQFPKNRELQERINKCWREHPDGFYVNVQKPMKDAKQTIFYIGRYLGRAAIAEYRIVNYDGQEVTFWYEDHETGKREYLTLPVYRFMARLVQHIPPKNFPMVRRYGFYARNVSEKIREIVKSFKKGVQKVFEFFTGKKKWRERRVESFGKDPLKCPNCGAEMEVWQIWHPKYGFIYDFMRDDTTEFEWKLINEGEKQEETGGVCQLLMPFMQPGGANP